MMKNSNALQLHKKSGEKGSATAEFVAVMPAVVLVLTLCITAIHAVTIHVQLNNAAGIAARSLARGDSVAKAENLAQHAMPSLSLTTDHSGDIVCAHVKTHATSAIFGIFPLSARSCALGVPEPIDPANAQN